MPNSIAIFGAVICGSALISSIIFSDVFCRVPELVTSVPELVHELVPELSKFLSELFVDVSEPFSELSGALSERLLHPS